MTSPASGDAAAAAATIRPSDYAHSPAHHAVVLGDSARLSRLLSSLPRLAHPSTILTPADAALQSRLADAVSSILDRRDVPSRDIPLHLAVRLDLPPTFLSSLLSAGADPSLQNADGWTPLQESLVLRRRHYTSLLIRYHRLSAFSKFRRRLPPLLSAMHHVQDFYLELSFHFESPLLPFLHRAAPSDTYRIWKRGDSLRADTSLAGFDGLRVRRADQSFLFLGSGTRGSSIRPQLPPGSLLVLNRARRHIHDAFEMDEDGSDGDIVSDPSAYRPGLDITAAELVPSRNWRGRERSEAVGEWKARVYDVHNVVFSFKTMKAVEEAEQEILPLELTVDEEEGYLVAELPELAPRRSCYEPRGGFGDVEGEIGRGRRSLDGRRGQCSNWERVGAVPAAVVGKRKEKEMVKSLRPSVWLTEDFPLKTEEFLPLLDILANKVKAVRRLRELLTTKFPPGTFPVKIAIPIVPTVRVVVTFTKFVNLQPPEQFYTPFSSPRHLSVAEEEEDSKPEISTRKSSWLKWNNNPTTKTSTARSKSVSPAQVVDNIDPFTIPSDYKWVSINSKSQKMKKSRSRKGKPKELSQMQK